MSDSPEPPPAQAAVEETAPPKKRMVKRKPARKQVEQGQIEKKQPEQTGQTYNHWYHKWAGGDKYDTYGAKEKSQTRVDIKKDAGYTRADGGNNNYICLFFARGCCPYGSECSYLHRLPPPAHVLPDASLDVFGREKHSGYRDDMGGVGSFNRQNRTLYIGRIKETRDTAEVIEDHFSEFGEIERIKILQSRGVAFVTYVTELNAQFAKEAMMHQSLEGDEVLNVRWATEDPNPAAKRSELQRLKDQGAEGISKALDPEFVQRVRELDELEGLVEPRQDEDDEVQEEGEGRGAKRARIEQEPNQPQPPLPLEAPPPPASSTLKNGILSADAVGSLQFMASLRAQKGTGPVPIEAKKTTTTGGGLGGLAAYGSDDDSD
ncbi:active spliceosome conformation promoter CWC2 [Sporobolomyces salmoneus]|uniref:active spliceosome conformation promoter CWC2 n=1 Tax=Sporobolomyces salmoneus TaxID=183962 RepID=UPI003171B019